MSDKIVLEVNGKRIEDFLSYSVDADLFTAAHIFSLEIRKPPIKIEPGMPCRLFVNNQLELTGVIDQTVSRCDKQGRTLSIVGRDLMGLIIDTYCEDFRGIDNMTLQDLATMLLKNIKFINIKQVSGELNLHGKIRSRQSRGISLHSIMFDTTERVSQIWPGMTVFEVLHRAALSAGVMFFCLPDGSFKFDRPIVSGDIAYHITLNERGDGNNVLYAEIQKDLSKRYSKITVMGQRNLRPGDDPKKASFVGHAYDKTFPFYKPYVKVIHDDSQSPNQMARLILEKMAHDGFHLTYDLPRHSQNNRNFTINQLAQVTDEVHGINGAYLVYGRTFKLDKQSGPITTLRLGPTGLITS
jgi:prophage tail gpP-like protein